MTAGLLWAIVSAKTLSRLTLCGRSREGWAQGGSPLQPQPQLAMLHGCSNASSQHAHAHTVGSQALRSGQVSGGTTMFERGSVANMHVHRCCWYKWRSGRLKHDMHFGEQL